MNHRSAVHYWSRHHRNLRRLFCPDRSDLCQAFYSWVEAFCRPRHFYSRWSDYRRVGYSKYIFFVTNQMNSSPQLPCLSVAKRIFFVLQSGFDWKRSRFRKRVSRKGRSWDHNVCQRTGFWIWEFALYRPQVIHPYILRESGFQSPSMNRRNSRLTSVSQECLRKRYFYGCVVSPCICLDHRSGIDHTWHHQIE